MFLICIENEENMLIRFRKNRGLTLLGSSSKRVNLPDQPLCYFNLSDWISLEEQECSTE